ncbi:hypothetical protein J4216_03850 [Candidatus Woesearchaeota archaeon]|nr:hypothetical protein [Candidatus Woesearchaeota archaeon]
MTRVIIDNRENREIVKALEVEELIIERKQLELADFIIETKTLDNKIQKVGIERKTQQDLLNSIIDKRLLNQLILLKENFDIPLLIIEGSENIYRLRDFHPNSIRGMISTIAIDFQIPIIYTESQKDTAKYIALIAKRLEKPRKPISLFAKRKPLTPIEQQLSIVESLPGVGPTIAKSLISKFKTIKKIASASEEQLMKIDKIGKKKAQELKKILQEEFN